MSNVDGVILDWAGTTVDFGCFAPVNVFLRIFRDAGITVTMAEARAPMGMLKRDHIATMLQMPRIQQLWREKNGRSSNERDIDDLYGEFFPLLLASLAQYTEPLPSVVATVQLLRESGLKIGSTTGYTDAMMDVVVAGARKQGYEPDFWITPDGTGSYGRPYPYMIFRNIEALRLKSVRTTVKIGDTVADIQEGRAAGVWSVGVIDGSSQMGLNFADFDTLSISEKIQLRERTRQVFIDAGAAFTITTLAELPALITNINRLLVQGKTPDGY